MQRQGVVSILAGGRIDAGQVVTVEHHGDGLIECIQLVQELLRGLIGNLYALLVGLD